MTKKENVIVGFKFLEIPLQEALDVVIVGDGNYADVSAHLLAVLPKIEEENAALEPKDKKSFAFGLGQGKEVPEAQRRGLIATVNKILRKARLLWRVTYSGKKKLFICVPTAVKSETNPEVRRKNQSSDPARVAAFIEIAKDTFKTSDFRARGLRMAISVVGMNVAGLTSASLAPYLGMSKSGVAYSAQNKRNLGTLEVKKLTEAIKGGK